MVPVVRFLRRLSFVFQVGGGIRRKTRTRRSTSAARNSGEEVGDSAEDFGIAFTASAAAITSSPFTVPTNEALPNHETEPGAEPRPSTSGQELAEESTDYLVCKDSGVVVNSENREQPNWIDLVADSNPGPVKLERIALHDGTILGSVSVANLAYEKRVYVRWTLDGMWYSDTMCKYVSSDFTAMRDYFSFDLPATGTVELHLKYMVAGQTHYDTNHGENYVILLS